METRRTRSQWRVTQDEICKRKQSREAGGSRDREGRDTRQGEHRTRRTYMHACTHARALTQSHTHLGDNTSLDEHLLDLHQGRIGSDALSRCMEEALVKHSSLRRTCLGRADACMSACSHATCSRWQKIAARVAPHANDAMLAASRIAPSMDGEGGGEGGGSTLPSFTTAE